MRGLLLLNVVWLGLSLLMGGCGRSQPTYTPTPTKTFQAGLPSALPPTATETAAPVSPPTPATLQPGAQPAPESARQATAKPAPIEPAAVLLTVTAPPPTALPVNEVPAASAPETLPPEAAAPETPSPQLDNPAPQPGPILPPQRGGSWDMEEGFYVWPSPFERYGGFVANGWASFIRAYQPDADPPNAPRLNENKREDNVYSGQRSQEISFDYRTGAIGLYRTATVTPGNRYTIEAWAKYASSPSGVQLDLGVDPTGGSDFEAETVVWYPWRDLAPDRWAATQETVRAAGDRLTLYLRAIHAVPELGGNTMFDNVSLTDIGP